MGEMWDVVVAGAGPAGSLTAMLLARAGAEVLLVERSSWPRDKVCGGCLNPRGLGLLEARGVAMPCLEKFGGYGSMTLRGYGRCARLDLPAGVVVDRSVFDAELVEAAVVSGVRFRSECRVSSVCEGLDEVSVVLAEGGSEHRVRSRVLVDASGIGSRVTPGAWERRGRLLVGLSATVDRSAWGGAAPDAGELGMAVGREGYVGVVGLGVAGLHVSAAVDPAAVVSEGAGAAGVIDRLLRSAWPEVASGSGSVPQCSWRGTGLLNGRPVWAARPRWFRVGDAAGYREPFTGEGMTRALVSANRLSQLILGVRSGRVDAASAAAQWRSWCRARHRGQWGCRVVSTLLRRRLIARGCMEVLSVAPGVARPLVRSLGKG
ncbi:MAG: FAD-dependent monooxygenase [Phycisphaeraceae bacterium]